MTEFDYPPRRTLVLETALTDLEDRVADLEVDFEDADEPGAPLRRDLRNARSQRDGLSWAVDEFGGDAEITLEAFTAATRARVLDTLRNETMGDIGQERRGVWTTAAGLVDAPWLEGDEDLVEQCRITEQLPPSVTDWLTDEFDSLNDLSEGN